MPRDTTPGKPTTRRCTRDEKEQAVRLVRQLRTETGISSYVAAKRVAGQLGYGVESVRNWVNRADIDDGQRPGTTSVEADRIKQLEQEVKELQRSDIATPKARVERSRSARR